ncbi:hypothetical protein CGRA01v4_03294 [Colletotrichum graminicola]|nr:hypothetical protein CGRA01v4_03294 [Colletotrichum graminicola]
MDKSTGIVSPVVTREGMCVCARACQKNENRLARPQAV